MGKILISSGCSFTFEPWNWPKHTSVGMGWSLKNVGMGSTGNGLISKKVIYHVEQELKIRKSEDIVVGIMWSGIDRNEFYVEQPISVKNNDGWSQNPTKIIEGRNNWLITNIHWTMDQSLLWYKNFHTDVGSVIETIENILRTQWYLESKGIKYFMSTYMDIFNITYKKRGMLGMDEISILKHPEIEYIYNLIDRTKFLNVRGCYEWVIENDEEEGMPGGKRSWGDHPTAHGHKMFSENVIIPFLKENGYE